MWHVHIQKQIKIKKKKEVKKFRLKGKKILVPDSDFLLLYNLGLFHFLVWKASIILPEKTGQEQVRRDHPASTRQVLAVMVPNAKRGICTVDMGRH